MCGDVNTLNDSRCFPELWRKGPTSGDEIRPFGQPDSTVGSDGSPRGTCQSSAMIDSVLSTPIFTFEI